MVATDDLVPSPLAASDVLGTSWFGAAAAEHVSDEQNGAAREEG